MSSLNNFTSAFYGLNNLNYCYLVNHIHFQSTGYLVIGLTFMMLTLALFYDIPQLNIGQLFKAHEDVDSEKARLATYGLGLQYGIDSKPDQEENTHRQVVRVRSRQRDDSPSPEDPPIGDFMK